MLEAGASYLRFSLTGIAKFIVKIKLIDGDKKVVSKQPFSSLSKSQFTAILTLLCQNRTDLVIRNEL